MTPNRTPGRNDFGRWDPVDDPQPGDLLVLFALNHPPYVVGEDGVLQLAGGEVMPIG